MLQRIVSIKNVGRFKSCSAFGDVTFRRFTLIFAENARGKTTFCAILRSLLRNAPALVLGRRTLGSPNPPDIEILTATGIVRFRNGTWSSAFHEIAIFDATYVSENVYAGDAVDTGHRRNLYKVIIGAQGVTLAADLDTLEGQIRERTTAIRENRAVLQRHMPQGMSAEAFSALPEDAEIDGKIAAKEQELQAARQATELQQRPGLSSLAVPVFPPGFPALLAKTFETVAEDAERRVGAHIARHNMQGRGEQWLTEGLRYVTDDTCPFCAHPLDEAGLIRDYRSFFSRAYHALRDEVMAMKGQVIAAVGDRIAASVEQTLLQNSNSAEFWRQYCDLVAPLLPETGRIAEITGESRPERRSKPYRRTLASRRRLIRLRRYVRHSARTTKQ